jgi:hypothetical protein
MASRRTTARLRKQASLAADLATDPQASVLRQALSEALSNYKFGVHQARGISGVVRKSATQAVPQMDQYFKTAQDSLQRNLASVGINPATVGGPAAADIADTQNRIALTQAAAKGELTSRANDAAAGLQFQVGNLASQYGANVNKINTQLADLAGQRGKTAESTLLQLLNQQAGRDVTLRGQTLSHQDRQAAADALGQYRSKTLSQGQERIDIQRRNASKRSRSKRGGRQPSTGLGSLSSTQESKVRDQLGEVVSVIKSSPKKDDTGKDLTPALIRQHLMSGNSPLKKPVPGDLVDVAYDLARTGKVSANSIKKLHSRGIHVPKAWIPPGIPGVSPGVYGPPAPGL